MVDDDGVGGDVCGDCGIIGGGGSSSGGDDGGAGSSG